MSTTKKITGLLLFFVLLGSNVFAQEKEQKVTNNELTTFASVFEKLQAANEEAQQKMVLVVENEGLEMKRFNEIHVAFVNSNMESNATKEELQKHKNAMEKIQKMQTELQLKMDGIVKKSGLSTKKYQRIALALKDNTALRDRYKKLTETDKE